MTSSERAERAHASLLGLALGDALGSQFFVPANRSAFDARTLPPGPWQWTDDTEMAASVFLVLTRYGTVDQEALATSFAERHDFDRGYGPGTGRLLRLVREGGDWRTLARESFDGQGSWGNGAAMRVAPLGAWYADDPADAARQAALSAEVTHPHPEAIAGTVAVAVAAAIAAASSTASSPAPGPFLDEVLGHVPVGKVRDGIAEARRLLTIGDPSTAAAVLGNGRQVAAHDTVPFTMWAAARNLGDYERAFWTTAAAGGDIDTTCAIVGGIVGATAGLPSRWTRDCEPLPAWCSPLSGP
ncbi:ADP-ribosylglycohydrolase family protein [Actinomadura xylanilytica]|uniref:ADP-ribosylglycohydrolase family protein n=1 Tax=Actinomadura xylanilytica TaxID=887459 RepID=UPI00255B2E78|nr:ADP-ribosylglycohydrolase family protein [Actinomadura xylanilytica]MDL4772930.1 ADP-ribosylglycohydrolase family protein [Actinomadura xylanilytica]